MNDIIRQMTIATVAAILLSIFEIIAIIILIYIQLLIKKTFRKELKEVVHNTNSIKDELVAEVRKASFAAGQKDQRNKKE